MHITERRVAGGEDTTCNSPGVQQAQSMQPASRPTRPVLGGGQESKQRSGQGGGRGLGDRGSFTHWRI